MNMSLIDKIIALAHVDDDIRAIILEGSFAAHFQVDELSDYDVNIYALNYEKYLLDDRWMSQIGQVLLYQKEQFQFYADVVPTRLVLFRDRERVDFSFWHLSLLSDIVRAIRSMRVIRTAIRFWLIKITSRHSLDRRMGQDSPLLGRAAQDSSKLSMIFGSRPIAWPGIFRAETCGMPNGLRTATSRIICFGWRSGIIRRRMRGSPILYFTPRGNDLRNGLRRN